MTDPALIIAHKEVLDALRDRRALFSALFFPLFGPLLIAGLLFGAATGADVRTSIGGIGIEAAPRLVATLSAHDIDVEPITKEAEAVVRAGTLPLVLRIPASFATAREASQPATVEIVADSSRLGSRIARDRVEEALEQYRSTLTTERLLGLGIHPDVLTPVRADAIDLASPSDRTAHLLETLVMFIVIAAFICSMYIAIDTTAGERERHSLEPLLLNPVSMATLVSGKFIATAVFSALGLALTTLLVFGTMSWVPLHSVGFRMHAGSSVVLTLLAVMLPLSWIAASTQLLVASFARSFKEAQTYLSLTLFVPIIPGLVLGLVPTDAPRWIAAVPVLGQQFMARGALRGEPIVWLDAALSMGSTAVLTAVCLWGTSRLFGREQVLFGE